MMTRLSLAGAMVAGLVALAFQQQVSPQKAKIYNDLKDSMAGAWIYDDLDAGIATAGKSKKPMLVVFRCVP